MRQFYRPFAVILALSAFAALNAQPSRVAGSVAGRMAFVSQQTSVNEIYLMDVDASGVGANPTRLTNDTEAENYPSWSPDGKRLVYQRDFNGSAIYLINADGAGQQRLSPTPGFDATPSWSADGTEIVYVRLLEVPQPNQPSKTDIRVMNVDGTGDHVILANTQFSVEPRWSVKDQIVFMSLMHSTDLQIYVMNADGSQLEQLTHFDPPYEAGDTNWSSDGTKIAFEGDIDGMKQSNPSAYAEVWTMNPDGSGETSTGVECSDVGSAPRWQPHIAEHRR
jgi:Tol biopolymer transport system component